MRRSGWRQMIDIDTWLRELDEEEDADIKADETYQKELFETYVLRKNDKYSELRNDLYRQYRAGKPLLGPNGLRKKLAAFDLAYFGRAYLSHYFVRKSPEFHDELDDIWSANVLKGCNAEKEAKQISRMKGTHVAVAAPRGHAKSTSFTFKDSLHATLYAYKHYIIILSDSSEQAEGFLDDIKTELEDNYSIIQDFGHLKGDKVWRSGVLLTSNDVKMEAIGSGKKIRGRKHRNWRPDLILLDDIENDENVNTAEQRRKLKSWFEKAVSKAGDTYTDIVYIGTILHYDSLLSNVLKNPRYRTKKYRAVISEAVNTQLWEEWQRIYTNLFDEQHEENARDFYEANEEDMLEGVEVLWSEKLSYYDLMEIRVTEGPASFNSELQNEPIDPDNATFNEEWLDFYEDEELAQIMAEGRYLLVGSNDPSLGKNKKADTSSIITLVLHLTSGYMYILDASVERRKPDVIINDILEMNRRYKRDYRQGYYKFGVETVQFQYFFKDVLAQKSLELGEYLPIEEINSSTNKMVRIESLQPLIKNHYIKFSRKHKALLQQMTEFPMGRNDDAPDGLQMAVQLAVSLRGVSGKVGYKRVQGRRMRFGKGAY